MVDTLTKLQGPLLGTSGDYWGQLKGDSLQLGKSLARAGEATRTGANVPRIANLLKKRRPVENKVVPFKEVIKISIDWNSREVIFDDRLRRPLQDEFNSSAVVGIGGDEVLPYGFPVTKEWLDLHVTGMTTEPMYLIHVPGVVPVSIRDHRGNIMTVGTSFSSSYPYVVFREDPEVTFPDKNIWVLSGVETGPTLFTYLHGAMGSSSDYHVSKFLRGAQSPRGYENALNAIAGSFVPRDTVHTQGVHSVEGYCKFAITEEGYLPLHLGTALAPHDSLPKDTPNPYLVKVHFSGGAREILMGKRLIRDFFGKGIPLPTGDITLLRSGDFVEIAYSHPGIESWNTKRETSEGDSLSDYLIEEFNISDGQSFTTNLSDHLVQKFYNHSMLLITIDAPQIAPDNLDDLMWFLDYHKPVNSLQFIVDPI